MDLAFRPAAPTTLHYRHSTRPSSRSSYKQQSSSQQSRAYDGTIYSTEVDNFSRVVSHGNGVTPDHFTLETKEGVIIEYGNSKNSFFENENSIKIAQNILPCRTGRRPL
jgi:hypothetical protein